VIVAVVNIKGQEATLWEAYQVAENLPQRINKVGSWITNDGNSAKKRDQNMPKGRKPLEDQKKSQEPIRGFSEKREMFGIMNSTTEDLIIRRRDLTGLHIRCSTIQSEPSTQFNENGDGTVNVGGTLGLVYQLLQQVTNFT
ncbi:hypothetical protein SK128_004528, partial [Halocaridina rubra]